jgi:serine/threonine-protein kinase RsbW
MVANLREGASAAPPASRQCSLIWRKTFPGTLDQPGRAREELTSALRASPDLDGILLAALDDIKTVTSELCTNAVIHTRSGHQGGTFKVEATAPDRESLLVAVSDGGAPEGPRLLVPALTDTHFRGLHLVMTLSSDCGVYGDAEGRTVWVLFARSGRAVPCPGEPC